MTREEAIGTIRRCCPKISDSECDFETAMRVLIPELAESEDERIRKQLIDAIKIGRSNSGISFTEEAASRYIAWLEKHSEEEIRKIRKEEYTNGFNDAAGFGKQKEQKPAEYLDKDKIYAIMKKLHDLSFSKDILIDSKEYKQINEITHDVRSLLDHPINQQPAEWSEEDDLNCNRIIRFLEPHKTFFPTKETKEEMQNWIKTRLKSLRPSWKPSKVCYGTKGDPDPAGVWKPSEEQMKALHRCIYYLHGEGSEYFEPIKSLYEQLKKL